MNRNDYRRALLMLRSLKTGVSGYVRLERRTLIGTLQFTINCAPAGMKLHAILLYRKNSCWSAVKLEEFGAPRYGQVGLLWKCDPRNIEGRTLEQYDLAAVIGISDSGLCDLLLCGNLNGSVETDWAQVRDAACRLFSPVRISGAPIMPIDEASPEKCENDPLQTLPDFSEENPLEPVEDPADPPERIVVPDQTDCRDEETNQPEPAAEAQEHPIMSASPAEQTDLHLQEPMTPDDAEMIPRDDLDAPALDSAPEATDLDTPTMDISIQYDVAAQVSDSAADIESDELDTPASLVMEPDELDMPAEERIAFALQSDDVTDDEIDSTAQQIPPYQPECAGVQLELSDPHAPWPDSIEPLRNLFFTSEAIVPFEAEGYVFIRAPLPEESGTDSCLCGLRCEGGFPARVCYAIPAPYTPEPPAGLEGYVWRGDRHRGYWVICEQITPDIRKTPC